MGCRALPCGVQSSRVWGAKLLSVGCLPIKDAQAAVLRRGKAHDKEIVPLSVSSNIKDASSGGTCCPVA